MHSAHVFFDVGCMENRSRGCSRNVLDRTQQSQGICMVLLNPRDRHQGSLHGRGVLDSLQPLWSQCTGFCHCFYMRVIKDTQVKR
jgi:hypothetical protein